MKKKNFTPLKNILTIGICGGSASGKTTVATKIIESLDVPWVTLLSMDSFYKVRKNTLLIYRFKNILLNLSCLSLI